MKMGYRDLGKGYGLVSESTLRKAGPPRILDNTMRTTFKQCMRKFYWSLIRKVDYLVRPSYFSWGSAWHDMKGSWLTSKGIKEEPYSEQWKHDATMALLIGLNTWDNSGSMDVKLDTRANLERLWKITVKSYPNELFSVIKGGAEVGWVWPLPLRGGQASYYFLGGSMDAIIYWEGFGYMPLEVKTTGIWLSDSFLLQWSFSSQITQYIWYVNQLLGSEQVYGAYLDITTKQNPAAAKAATTPQFSRPMQTRTEDDLKEFENDWRMDLELLERAYDKWHFPKTVDIINCTGGVGKSACPYKGFCLSGLKKGEIDPLVFPNLTYRKEMWEPWKRSPGERARKALTAFPGSITSHSLASKNKTEINSDLVKRLAWRNKAIFRGEVN